MNNARLREKLLELLEQTVKAPMAKRTRLISRANEMLADQDKTWSGVFSQQQQGDIDTSWKGKPCNDIEVALDDDEIAMMLVDLLGGNLLPNGKKLFAKTRIFIESLQKDFETKNELSLAQQEALKRNHDKFVKGVM